MVTLKILIASQEHEPFSDDDYTTPLLTTSGNPNPNEESVPTLPGKIVKQKTNQELCEVLLYALINKAFDEGDSGFTGANNFIAKGNWGLTSAMKKKIGELAQIYLPPDVELFKKRMPYIRKPGIDDRRSLVALTAIHLFPSS